MATIWHGFGVGRRLVPARIAWSMRGSKRSSRAAGSSSTAAIVVLLQGEQVPGEIQERGEGQAEEELTLKLIESTGRSGTVR